MLDELTKAADAIEAAGIFVKDWHTKLKPLPKVTPKAPCIRIWLDPEGHIADLEPLAATLAENLSLGSMSAHCLSAVWRTPKMLKRPKRHG